MKEKVRRETEEVLEKGGPFVRPLSPIHNHPLSQSSPETHFFALGIFTLGPVKDRTTLSWTVRRLSFPLPVTSCFPTQGKKSLPSLRTSVIVRLRMYISPSSLGTCW